MKILALLLLPAALVAQQPDSVKNLKEVTVTGRKPLVTRKADRFIINVQDSHLANGNTGLEVLQRSPGVWVDPNGAIRVKGGQGVTVMINDVVQRLSTEELASYLRTLRSEDISKIEVITNPPAEYEASGSGGIVHIVLKKARKDGYNGSLSAQYRQQGPQPYVNTGTLLHYKVNKWYLNIGYTFSKDIKDILDTAYMRYADKTSVYNYTNRVDEATRHQWRAGIGYDIAKDQYLELQHSINTSDFTNTFQSDLLYMLPGGSATGNTRAGKDRRFVFGSTTLHYLYKPDSLGSKFTLHAEHTFNKKSEFNHFEEVYTGYLPDVTYRTAFPFSARILSAQSNYYRVLTKKTAIGAGIKYVSMERDNELRTDNYEDSSWKHDPGASNHFIYKEQLLMGYANFNKTIKKITVKGGLRIEHTLSDGDAVSSAQRFHRSYTSLFPSLFVTQKIQQHDLFLSYSRRIQRPAMHVLNPVRFLFNNYTALIGNPELLPQYSNNMEAGFNWRQGYSATLYVSATSNLINMQVKQGPDNTIEYAYQNFGRSMEYGCNLGAPLKFGKVYSMNNNISLYHTRYSQQDIPALTSFSFRSLHVINIEKWLDIEAIADYRSPVVYPGWRNPDNFYFDMGFSKKLLKKKMIARLYISDIFNTMRELEITEKPTTLTVFYRKKPTRWVSLSITYNFSGGQKFNNRKLEPVNNEERRRVGS